MDRTGRDLVALNLGLNLNVGGQVGETAPVGFVLALTYSNKRQYTPDNCPFRPDIDAPTGNGRVLDESVAEVEWGGIGNVSRRPWSGTKLGWKNFYSRGAEETRFRASGIAPKATPPTTPLALGMSSGSCTRPR